MDLRPVPRYEWEQILRRARVTGLIAGTNRTGKDGRQTRGGISAAVFKAVAMTIASYGNGDGTDVFPGDATIAVDLECSLQTVKSVRQALVNLGLLQRLAGRRRDRNGEEYRLTLPVDLLDLLDVPTPAAQKLAAKRLRDEARGKPGKPADGVSAGPPEPPVDNSILGGPADTPAEVEPETLGGSAGTPENGFGGSAGNALGGPPEGRTKPWTVPTTTTKPNGEDLRTAVTVPGAEAVEDPDFLIEVNPDARWTARATVPLPPKCPHGLRANRRPDGTSSCAACRQEAIRGVTAVFPTIAAPRDGPLAEVIPIDRRSAS